ncbi:MAG: hypothetical protein UX25_C0001G0007 [Candidatus Woesebacteria bacterium GW2011_GWC2_45_9]|uniref:Membrane protein 6-pyruvoyl-tetrahydropterin synthase-related domain-containing protein n=2 Tax=Microgenomates group TaxID=1794810 RepID=A0A0G1QJ40_9BACT|nr:MAG: hypothetical protein UX25_C0001G0007 [Candidatus Woesebacteria bacterium GW2011_GWC2_45_9]
MKYKKLLLSLFLLLVFWRLFLPYPHVANDLHHLYRQGLNDNFLLPPTFRDFFTGDGLGQRIIFVLAGWFIHPFFSLFGKLGVDFTYQMMLFGFLPTILFSIWGISKLLESYRVEGWGRLFGTLLYLSNTYILLLIDGGQITLALAYSLFPGAVYYFNNSLSSQSLRPKLILTLVLLGISVFDLRIFLLLAIVFILKAVFDFLVSDSKLHLLKNLVITASVASLFVISAHLYWLVPALVARGNILPEALRNAGGAELFSFANLGHSIFLISPHWYKNIFGQATPILPEFALIPLLVFLAPIVKRKDRQIAFWLTVALLGIFLAKGVNPPLGEIYTFLFSKVPGFSFFRDPTKFFFLIVLAYSVLFGFTIEALSKRLVKYPKLRVLFLLLMAGYLLFLIRPVWLDKMTGTFSKPIYLKEYLKLANEISSDKAFSRTFWIPTVAPLGFVSENHPALDAYQLLSKRPFAIGVSGSYELFNYLRADYMGQLFDVSGIGYIVYPYPDVRRTDLKPDNVDYYHWFLNTLAKQPWVIPADVDSSVPVLTTSGHQDKFFVPSNTWLVVGSDDVYSTLNKIGGFKLSENALVFSESQVAGARIAEKENFTGIIFNRKESTDLAANLLENGFIFPARNLKDSPDDTGWWKRDGSDVVNWRNFLQEKYGLDNLDFDYGGGWAVAEGPKELKVESNLITKNNIVLARVMKSSLGGKIDFYQRGSLIGSVNTSQNRQNSKTKEYEKADFLWVEIGRLISESPIDIKTQGKLEVINTIAVITEKQWRRALDNTDSLLSKNEVISLNNKAVSLPEIFNPSQEPSLSYKRINPTDYEVRVTGIKKPTLLVYSTSYDPLWRMEGEESISIYSLLNGFPIEKDGVYKVAFSPQKYVNRALIVSLLAVSLLLVSLFLTRTKKKLL